MLLADRPHRSVVVVCPRMKCALAEIEPRVVTVLFAGRPVAADIGLVVGDRTVGSLDCVPAAGTNDYSFLDSLGFLPVGRVAWLVTD